MRGMPRVRHVTSLVLATALLLSAGAQCLLGAEMTTAPMACCAEAGHDCVDVRAVPADCCQIEQAPLPQPLERIHQLAPSMAVLTSATGAPVRAAQTASRVSVDTIPVRASSKPKYVLLATFLI